MRRITISIPRLFESPAMTAESLIELANQAWRIAEAPYSEKANLPANIHLLARRLAMQASYCADLLANSVGAAEMMRAGYDLGSLIQEINRVLVAWAALKQRQGELFERQQRASVARDRKAQQELAVKHDWPAIAHRVEALRAAGVSDREMAAEIERLHSVPARTFRAWRKKQNGN